MVTITDEALGHLRGLIQQQEGGPEQVGLRVYVQSGGCSGFSYGMGLDENQPKEDDEVVAVDGVKVYVDSYSAQYLEGAEIDYVDSLMGGGFTIHNPNAAKTCSCGHSFQTADGAGTPAPCS
ncbi:MAG TPA: iron-sulfur cluster assembly accessory protein [Candidatus Sulfotelmatobacter sp.]|jgi:iron-sulfur cluster assembly protein|nr:iron-sulfur cluster assembly accessory protein [Candidatus Sulfotelmatobacter sp.]